MMTRAARRGTVQDIQDLQERRRLATGPGDDGGGGDMEARISRLETDVSEIKGVLARLEPAIIGMVEEQRAFRQELTTIREEQRSIREELTTVREEQRVIREEQRVIREELTAIREEQREQRREMSEFRKEMLEMRKDIARIDSKLSYLDGRVTHLPTLWQIIPAMLALNAGTVGVAAFLVAMFR